MGEGGEEDVGVVDDLCFFGGEGGWSVMMGGWVGWRGGGVTRVGCVVEWAAWWGVRVRSVVL